MKSIDKVLSIARQEIGYLEKRSNSQLDSKTANAGSNNYTKYARDLYPSLQDGYKRQDIHHTGGIQQDGCIRRGWGRPRLIVRLWQSP